MCILQPDTQQIRGEAYIVFGIILFFWELLPTSLVVVFFRVQRPNQNLVKKKTIHLNYEQWIFFLKCCNDDLNISLCYISQAPAGMINSHSFSSRTYFFDNPRRYDSDDDLSRGSNSRADLARWAHTNKVQTQSRVCFFNSTELKYTRTEKSILSLINSFSYPLPPSSSVKTFSQPPPISQSTLFHFPDRRI